jgi:hypothetical protein
LNSDKEKNCDMSRGFYTRHARDAAVMKLIARPMLHIFFPELYQFEQPLSGEVCARRQVWYEWTECWRPSMTKESKPSPR